MHKSPHFRGYNRAGFEYTRGTQDWREQVDFGAEREELSLAAGNPPWKRLIGPNQFPSALPELRAAVLKWIDDVTTVGLRILQAFSEALGHRCKDIASSAGSWLASCCDNRRGIKHLV